MAWKGVEQITQKKENQSPFLKEACFPPGPANKSIAAFPALFRHWSQQLVKEHDFVQTRLELRQKELSLFCPSMYCCLPLGKTGIS